MCGVSHPPTSSISVSQHRSGAWRPKDADSQTLRDQRERTGAMIGTTRRLHAASTRPKIFTEGVTRLVLQSATLAAEVLALVALAGLRVRVAIGIVPLSIPRFQPTGVHLNFYGLIVGLALFMVAPTADAHAGGGSLQALSMLLLPAQLSGRGLLAVETARLKHVVAQARFTSGTLPRRRTEVPTFRRS